MNTDSDSLGGCSSCGASIPPAYLLIRYETDDGDTAAYAECPNCESVVNPE